MLRKLQPLTSRITRGSRTVMQQRRGMAGGEVVVAVWVRCWWPFWVFK